MPDAFASETNDKAPDISLGRLRKYHSNFYYVELQTGLQADKAPVVWDETLYECSLKGVLKKALKSEGNDILVGDVVQLDTLDPANQTARIVAVESRKNSLSRPKIANVDQALIVCSLKQPDLDLQQLDRYLTHVTLAGIQPVLCISKTDLGNENPNDMALLQRVETIYHHQLGYPVLTTSVYQLDSLSAVKTALQNQTTVLAGPSGAGKSSLLNALNSDLHLRIGDVSERIERGQHTTRHVELLKVDANTFVADTPGFSHLRLDYILPQAVEVAFPEFRHKETLCEFADCLHLESNPGCSVLTEDGQPRLEVIAESRYQSYRSFLEEAFTYKAETQQSSQKQDYGFKQMSNKGKKDLQVLRLKEKHRESARRTQRQQVASLLEEGDDETDEAP